MQDTEAKIIVLAQDAIGDALDKIHRIAALTEAAAAGFMDEGNDFNEVDAGYAMDAIQEMLWGVAEKLFKAKTEIDDRKAALVGNQR